MNTLFNVPAISIGDVLFKCTSVLIQLPYLFTVGSQDPQNDRDEEAGTPKSSATDEGSPIEESVQNGENNFLSLMLNGERGEYANFIHNPYSWWVSFGPYKKSISLVLIWSCMISEGCVWVNCLLREEIPDFICRWCRKVSPIRIMDFNTENMRNICQIRLTTFNWFICVVWNYSTEEQFFILDKMETWNLHFLHQGSAGKNVKNVRKIVRDCK